MLLRVFMKKGHTAQMQLTQLQQRAPGQPPPAPLVQALAAWYALLCSALLCAA